MRAAVTRHARSSAALGVLASLVSASACSRSSPPSEANVDASSALSAAPSAGVASAVPSATNPPVEQLPASSPADPDAGIPAYTWQRYGNARFAYALDYPSFFEAQPESANGDGRAFVWKTRAKATCWGIWNAMTRSLDELYVAAVMVDKKEHPRRVVTYKTRGNDWFVVSGTDEVQTVGPSVAKRLFYEKTILRDNVITTLLVEYDPALKDPFDPVVARIANSFTTIHGGQFHRP